MAHRKAGGTARNLRDSQPKYLGLKIHDGEFAKVGNIILRQRGTVYLAGENTKLGRDHTIFALAEGKVKFKDVRKGNFDGSKSVRKQVSILTK